MKQVAIFAMMAATVVPVMAQLDNTVEVTNEVKTEAAEATKVGVKAQVAETQVTHYPMSYAVEAQPLTHYAEEVLANYESEEVWKGNKKKYVHIGGGSHGNVDAMAAWQIDLNEKNMLNADFSLQGFNGKVKRESPVGVRNWQSRDYRNRATLAYRHLLDGGADFRIEGAFENRVFNYLNVPASTDKQHDVLGAVSAGISPCTLGDLTLDASAHVKFFSQNYVTSLKEGLGETLLGLNANGFYRMADEHGLGLGVEFVHTAYGNEELAGITRLRFTPHYIYGNEQMELKLGVFASTKGHVAPDARVAWHLDCKSDVYAQVRGYEEDNDFRRLSELHPCFAIVGDVWGRKTKMEATYHQTDVRVGYRFKDWNGFGGDLNAGFETAKNHAELECVPQIDNEGYSWVGLVKNRCFYLNADFSYAYADVVNVEARNQLNMESDRNDEGKWESGSYECPLLDVDWTINVKVVKNLHVGLDWRLLLYNNPDLGEGTCKRPDSANLGANIRYTVPMRLPFTIFIKGDNLLNSRFDRYVGYRHIGANVLAGFALSF